MSQTRVSWMVSSISVLALAVLALVFGITLMPRGAVAIRDGKMVPWVLTWGMIWVTTVSAIIIAAVLALVAAGRVRGAEPN